MHSETNNEIIDPVRGIATESKKLTVQLYLIVQANSATIPM